MARVWRRNGVKKAWVQAGAFACALFAVLVWGYAPFAVASRFGMAAMLVWEVPTLGAGFAFVLWTRWMRRMAAQYAASAAPAAAEPDLNGPPMQAALPGLEDPSGDDQAGAWPSCSLEEREHG